MSTCRDIGQVLSQLLLENENSKQYLRKDALPPIDKNLSYFAQTLIRMHRDACLALHPLLHTIKHNYYYKLLNKKSGVSKLTINDKLQAQELINEWIKNLDVAKITISLIVHTYRTNFTPQNNDALDDYNIYLEATLSLLDNYEKSIADNIEKLNSFHETITYYVEEGAQQEKEIPFFVRRRVINRRKQRDYDDNSEQDPDNERNYLLP